MADNTVLRKNKLILRTQNVAQTLSKAHDEVQDMVEEFVALATGSPFDAAYFTDEAANLGITKTQFDDVSAVLSGFLAYIDEVGQDRKGKLLRVKPVG